ncbi:PSAT [Symbiodinium pilosum]|uniref:PSAT protein n=1 Tax=Symbiodinium pilosum TaxID=2952 RepID=A0A812TF59_SYMPI|nr:PSAT [Symbiodinium pilosum]
MKAGFKRTQLEKVKEAEDHDEPTPDGNTPFMPYVPASPAKVPLRNSDCKWNYRKARCEPKYACEYKFRAGDFKLGQSCRLKIDKFKPTSDKDCLWNYKEVKCHDSLYCSRQCKAGDFNLDACCKLRKSKPGTEPGSQKSEAPSSTTTATWESHAGSSKDESEEDVDDDIGLKADWTDDDSAFVDQILKELDDEDIGLESDSEDVEGNKRTGEDIGLEADDEASPEHDDGNAGEKDGEEEGNCKSESDRTILKKPDVPEELEKIGTASWSTRRWKIVREKSLKLHMEKLNLSELCSTCFVDVSDCSTKNCFSLLARKGKSHPESAACIEEHCNQALLQCTGLSKEELP